MQTDQFDFDLPPHLIALRPAQPRDSARLMVIRGDGELEHRFFSELPVLLRKGDILSFNDSKVIPARLTGYRPSREGTDAGEVEVEITLHKRTTPERFLALARPAKRLRPGDSLRFGNLLTASVVRRDGGEVELAFDKSGESLDRSIAAVGVMPLPPYIARKRAPDAQDQTDYQTIYSRHAGSVAAPTAGLHFTTEMLDRIRRAGIGEAYLTLHVGPGTFLPVTAEDTDDHVMHAEHAVVSADVADRLNAVRAGGGRIAAVGTTALRTLESAVDESGRVHPFEADTRLFITPGYRFKAVDILLTNFHLPGSTLFMLASAFSGVEAMRYAYAEAIKGQYRFYSYGDACLLFRPK